MSRTVTTTHTVLGAGYHTLKIWMVDPAVVVQKIVVHTPESKNPATYLGPPESFRRELVVDRVFESSGSILSTSQ